MIVGASLAGAKAAEELRERGFDGRVVLIGSESERPYERPPLTKDYLRGESEREKAYVHDEGFYEQHEIELRPASTVTAIDPASSRGHARRRSRARLRPAAADAPAPSRGGYRSRARSWMASTTCARSPTATRCASVSRRGGHVVVVGAGWIGSEVRRLRTPARPRGDGGRSAGAAQRADLRRRDRRVLPRRARQHGVELVLGEGVDAFEGDGAVARVRTSGGAGDRVRLRGRRRSASRRARSSPATPASTIDNGILVDEKLQTSAPNVFAAGDVANAWHPFYGQRIRVEHWANALNQGPAARAGDARRVPSATTASRTSSPTSTTSEWSTRATPPSGIRSCSAATATDGEFIAFWLATQRVARRHERQRLGRQRARPGADPLAPDRRPPPR